MVILYFLIEFVSAHGPRPTILTVGVKNDITCNGFNHLEHWNI